MNFPHKISKRLHLKDSSYDIKPKHKTLYCTLPWKVNICILLLTSEPQTCVAAPHTGRHFVTFVTANIKRRNYNIFSENDMYLQVYKVWKLCHPVKLTALNSDSIPNTEGWQHLPSESELECILPSQDWWINCSLRLVVLGIGIYLRTY